MATEIFVCLDLGNDTIKLSFAFDSLQGETCGKLMLPDLINQVALPAAACYDEDARAWRFAEELERVDNSHFSTVVKIKSLLSLFNPQSSEKVTERNRMYYQEKSYFPRFTFPIRHRTQSDFQYLVDQKLVFEAPGYTPQQICEAFFSHIRKKIEMCIIRLSVKTGIKFAPLQKIALVYPPKLGDEYIDELVRLTRLAFGCQPVKLLTSTQALGLLAFHQGLLDNGERTLLVDMGDETISVAKAWLNEIGQNIYGDRGEKKIGILIDSPEGHSKPLELGGSDLDEDIAAYLEDSIHDRETVGSPSVDQDGHIYENGLCATQYLLMKDIKKVKMLMPMTEVGGIFKDGVPISIHRETLVQRLMTPLEFYNCMGMDEGSGVANKILKYLLNELALPGNRDITKILFAGGTIESFGLLDYLDEKLRLQYPRIQCLTFKNDLNDGDDFSIQFFEASTYASALGGAVVAMKDYSVDAVLSFSYGTWLYHDNTKKHLKLFANRGDLLLEEENRFAMEAIMDIDRNEQSFLEGDELFSTIINTAEIEKRAYADSVTYEGKWLIVGEAGDEDRLRAREAIDLRVVAGGHGTEIHFYFNGDRVAISSKRPQVIFFEEGFIVDKKGVAKPFFSNQKEKNNADITVRSLRTNKIMTANTRNIEFRLYMNDITVVTNT